VKRLQDKGVRVIECVFKNKGKISSVYAKKARGLMARYIVTENISAYNREGTFDGCLERLRLFNLEGYRFVEGGDSTDECLVFDRTSAPPTAAALKAAKKEPSSDTKLRAKEPSPPTAAALKAAKKEPSSDTKSRVKESSTAPAVDIESKILPEKKKSKR